MVQGLSYVKRDATDTENILCLTHPANQGQELRDNSAYHYINETP